MTAAWWLGNLAAWWLHAGALLLVGILAARWLRWEHAASRLRFLQGLLAVALLLPVLETWRPLVDASLAPAAAPGPLVVTAGVADPAAPVPWEWEPWVMGLLVAGTVARWAGLAAGVWRLRRLRRWRRAGSALTVDGLVGVEIRVVEGLRGPASFGWHAPVILLPAAMPAGALRDAALRHEYQHVIRRDWIQAMVEQAAAALLWFQPAVWWLLERIQLAREQAVDAAAAGVGQERDQYLDSLLVTAGVVDYPSLPVTHFVRRRHLVERVAQLTQERPMNIRQLVLSSLGSIGLAAGALFFTAGWVPLRAQPQPPPPPPPPPSPTSSPTPVAFVRDLRRIDKEPVRIQLPMAPEEGEVVVEVKVGAGGEVLDARVLSGPDALRRQALMVALGSAFSPELARRGTLTVTVEAKRAPARRSDIPPPPPPPPPPPVSAADYEGVDYEGLSPDVQQRVMPLFAGFRPGERFTEDAIESLRREVAAVDPKLALGTRIRFDPADGKNARLRLRVSAVTAPPTIRVGGGVQQASLVRTVPAEYPPLAEQAQVRGMVRFEAAIGKDGSVQRLRLLSGHPLLVTAAQRAAQQYLYRPTLLNGAPVEVVTTIEVPVGQ